MQNLIAHLPLRHLRRFIGITERKDGANLFGFWHAGYLGRYGFVTIPHDDRSQSQLVCLEGEGHGGTAAVEHLPSLSLGGGEAAVPVVAERFLTIDTTTMTGADSQAGRLNAGMLSIIRRRFSGSVTA